MKMIRRRRLIVFIGILLIIAGIVLGGSLAEAAAPTYSNGQDIVAVSVLPTGSSPAMKLTEEDMTAISDTLKTPAAWWGSVRGQISTELRNIQADVYAVGGPFAQLHPAAMLYGSFLPGAGSAGNSIVLDKDLAWQLFGTVNAVGMETDFQGKTYAVTGVCDTDTSLPGLLSGNGTGKAYISYNQYDSVPITGMEVSLPKALTGKSLQAVKNALGAQGKAVTSFLFTDITERALMDAETSKLPQAMLAFLLTILLVAITVRILSGIAKETWSFAKEVYFKESWKAVLWRVSKMLIVCIAGAGLVYTLWLLADFQFYLPARYIPSSWIDLDFYKNLIKTEAQAAIAARAYLPQPWDISHDASMQLAGWMNVLALSGMAVFALGLQLLRDARESDAVQNRWKGWRCGANDIPSIWIYTALSLAACLLVLTIAGLPFHLPVTIAAFITLGLSLWAARRLYNDAIINLFHHQKGNTVHADLTEPGTENGKHEPSI